MIDPFNAGLLSVVIIIAMVVLGVRVAYASGIAGVIGLVWLRGYDAGAGLAGLLAHSEVSHVTLSVLPMFILIGFLAFYAGLTQSAFYAARCWLGTLPGGLAVATVFATAGFAAVSGASTATAAVFSRVAIPEMLKYGYDRSLAAGVVAAGGTLASLIPPSAILVIYAIIVEESVGALLLAGFIPGALSAVIYAALIVFRCKLNPTLGAPVSAVPLAEKFRSLVGASGIFFVIVIILGGIYTGWMTPTEVGGVAAFVIFLIALAKRNMGPANLRESLMETAKLTVFIFTIIWSILIYVRFLGFSGLPEAFANFVVGLDVPPDCGDGPDPARLCRARHVHGRHRDAASDLAGRLSGSDGARLRPGLVRHHHRQDGGSLPGHAAYRPELLRGQRRATGYSAGGCLQGHLAVLRG